MTKKLQPKFIGVGFQRCGTSWLNKVLYEHPEIGKPESGVHFFNEKFDLGKEWYEECLAELDPGTGVVGEFCTAYSYPDNAKEVADRIFNLYPETKILISIREPVSRCISDLHRSLRRGEVGSQAGTMLTSLQENPVLIERSYYAGIVEHYFSLFPRNNIKVVSYEDISNQPLKLLESLYSFLGVDETFKPESLAEKVGATYPMRFVFIERVVVNAQKMMKRAVFLLPGSIRKPIIAIGKKAVSKIRKANRKKNRNYDQELRYFLEGQFDNDIKRVAQVTGLNLDHWLSK